MELVSDGLLDRDLLRRKLLELDEREKELEKELAAARATEERMEDLEALKGELFLRYMYEGPEMLYHWTPEQRVALYRRIGFRAVADEEGNLSATWLFGAETFGVPVESTTRCFPNRRTGYLPWGRILEHARPMIRWRLKGGRLADRLVFSTHL